MAPLVEGALIQGQEQETEEVPRELKISKWD
jgi:hypothetical protein